MGRPHSRGTGRCIRQPLWPSLGNDSVSGWLAQQPQIAGRSTNRSAKELMKIVGGG
jgi:hypothetical protein